MMLTHCGNNVRNRYSGCVFSVKDIVPVPLKTSRNRSKSCKSLSTKSFIFRAKKSLLLKRKDLRRKSDRLLAFTQPRHGREAQLR